MSVIDKYGEVMAVHRAVALRKLVALLCDAPPTSGRSGGEQWLERCQSCADACWWCNRELE